MCLRVRIQTIDRTGNPSGTPRVVKKISNVGADDLKFTLREGGTKTVSQYFHEQRNKPLQFKHLLCAEVPLFHSLLNGHGLRLS